MATFNLQIVTPDRLFFEGEVDMVVARTTVGDVAILKDHINYVATLGIGEAKIKTGDTMKIACIAGGFIQVGEDQTTILTEAAEWPEEIDLDRAKRAKEHAEAVIARRLDDMALSDAEIKLKRAISRINTAEKNY